MFDCLTVTKPTLLLLQDHWSSGNQWGDCTCLIAHSDKTYNVAFTGPLILWYSVRWLYILDCLTMIKPTMLLLQDHWSSGNQWGDCTCLIVSQRQNLQCCFYRTTGPLVISEMTVHVWLSHSDKTYNVAFADQPEAWFCRDTAQLEVESTLLTHKENLHHHDNMPV